MPASRVIRRKVEIYATTLFEFASKAGTEAQTLDALQAVENSVAEVRSTVLVLAKLGKADLIPQVSDAYARLQSGDDALEASEVATVAKTLYDAVRNEHHSTRVLKDLQSLRIMTPEVMDTLAVLGTGSDRRLLPSIVSKYRSLVDEEGSTIPLEVTTAFELDDALRDEISHKMEAELGKPVYLMEHVNPAIIGGLIIGVGDDVRDASVRAQLEHMRRVLSTNDSPATGEISTNYPPEVTVNDGNN